MRCVLAARNNMRTSVVTVKRSTDCKDFDNWKYYFDASVEFTPGNEIKISTAAGRCTYAAPAIEGIHEGELVIRAIEKGASGTGNGLQPVYITISPTLDLYYPGENK